jgi:UDP-GlcNAc:undecaprenyl-phosphate/decaprenyl-phosphate GlcNAc-1-phosphate transferase
VREYLLTLILTAAVTYLLTPLVRRVAVATGAMHVGRERDVHTEPVPKLGGLAMYGGLAAGLLIASRISPLRTIFAGSRMAAGLLIAGGLLVIVGFVDDRWELNWLAKLAARSPRPACWCGAALRSAGCPCRAAGR